MHWLDWVGLLGWGGLGCLEKWCSGKGFPRVRFQPNAIQPNKPTQPTPPQQSNPTQHPEHAHCTLSCRSIDRPVHQPSMTKALKGQVVWKCDSCCQLPTMGTPAGAFSKTSQVSPPTHGQLHTGRFLSGPHHGNTGFTSCVESSTPE